MTESKLKTNSVITHAVAKDEATGAVTITFKVAGAGETKLTLPNLSQEVRDRAVIHGLVQRIADAAAKSRDTTTGKPAEPSVRLAAMTKLVDHYNSGSVDWSPVRVGRGGKEEGLDEVILQAVAEVTAKPVEDVRTMILAQAAERSMKPGAYLAALGTSKRVSPVVERLRAEAAGGLGDDLLGEMVGDGGAE